MKRTALALMAGVFLILGGCSAAGGNGPVYAPGSWSQRVYSTSFVGAQFTLPEGWEHASAEELEAMDDGDNAALNDQKDSESEPRYFYDLSARNPETGEGVILLVQKSDTAPKTYANALKAGANAEDADYTMGDGTTVDLHGADYLMLPLTISDGTLQRQYVRSVGPYLVNIMMFSGGNDPAVFANLEACFAPLP